MRWNFRGRRSDLVGLPTALLIFVFVALISTLEKALFAGTVFAAIWVAVTERWENRKSRTFWYVVGLFAVADAAAIWAIPITARFKSGLAVSFPVGMAEGLLLYWLLGKLKPQPR